MRAGVEMPDVFASYGLMAWPGYRIVVELHAVSVLCTPQNDLQAQARAHRIGQTETVNIYR